ncbi:hypothetical protein D3C83_25100 [compost metagenome]
MARDWNSASSRVTLAIFPTFSRIIAFQAASLASLSSTSWPVCAKPSSARIGTANSTGSTSPPMRRQTGFNTSQEYRPIAPCIQTMTTTKSCRKAYTGAKLQYTAWIWP